MWNVMCNVSKIVVDIDKRCGHMYLPEYNCPDMSRTIKCFQQVDDEINIIYTYIDGVPDVVYAIIDGEWEARYPFDHKRNGYAVHQKSPPL